MFKQIFQIVLILLVCLLSFSSSFAKGAPAKITIEGPSISEALEIADDELLGPFGWGEFADFSTPIDVKTHAESGYTITRYVLVGGNTMRSLDMFTYFPALGDEESIVFYKGIIDKKLIVGGTPHDGKWFRVSLKGEAAIQRIFDAYGISTGENSPSTYSFQNTLYSWKHNAFI